MKKRNFSGFNRAKKKFAGVICCLYELAGMSGPVKIDEKGNRVPRFVFENIHKSSGSALLELDSNGTVIRRFNVRPVWPGGSTKIPDDEPECVFDDSCKGKFW